MTDKVKEFWDEQARLHGGSDQATAPDHYYRELEIGKIIEHLDPGDHGESVLDVGCGNGYSTVRFARAYPSSEFIGMDYSTDMITEARNNPPANVSFTEANMLIMPALGLFDTIISTRCLINLADWDEQQTALINMKRSLTPAGKIILVENFDIGLSKLNILREQFGLPEIKQRWHNHYLPYFDFMRFAQQNFHIEHSENIGNLYYIISRVIYAAICKEQGVEPDYKSDFNRIASKLPSLGRYGYSPNYLHVLRHPL